MKKPRLQLRNLSSKRRQLDLRLKRRSLNWRPLAVTQSDLLKKKGRLESEQKLSPLNSRH